MRSLDGDILIVKVKVLITSQLFTYEIRINPVVNTGVQAVGAV